jgi:tetratricopeptide (TPR) repeat protein
MSAHPNAARQPTPQQLQPMLAAFQQGRFADAERLARELLKVFPQAMVALSVLGSSLAQGGRLAEAVEPLTRAAQLAPQSPEAQFNLAAVLAGAGRNGEAETAYRRVLALNPRFTVAHFNLGALLQGEGRSDEAMACYQHAIEQEPGFIQAIGNLGSLLQARGRLPEAIDCYRRCLAIRPDARAHFNLGTALRDAGKLEAAAQSYREALALDPAYAEALNNLGEIERDLGNFREALACFEAAIRARPGYGQPHYNIGLFHYDSGKLAEALPHFEASRHDDWLERVLVCLYKTRQYEAFRQRFQAFLAVPHRSPMAANLSAHHAANFGQADPYNFCSDPLGHVWHTQVDALTDPASDLRARLLADITRAQIDERNQGRLHHGVQSAGNLFKRPEASFAELSALILAKAREYAQHFAESDCVYIRDYPQEPAFNSSWYVRMRQGGHLDSHIHETGWMSGVVYLDMPSRSESETDGCIEFSIDGDRYPREREGFQTLTLRPLIGDLVFFPSSLFHRTVPFSADVERTCIAFDIAPPRFTDGGRLPA